MVVRSEEAPVGREAWAARAEAASYGGPERSNRRYSLTFSANARNVFNNVNPAPPIGNLSSGLLGNQPRWLEAYSIRNPPTGALICKWCFRSDGLMWVKH